MPRAKAWPRCWVCRRWLPPASAAWTTTATSRPATCSAPPSRPSWRPPPPPPKPVFLHQRDAHGDFVAILKEFRGRLAGGVAHCFTGGRSELEDYLALDLHIGVTGWVNDERRGHSLREALPHIPSDRLMVETDAPYLLPRDLKPAPKSRRNEPCFLPHIAAAIARLRGESLDALAESTTRNAVRFFGLGAGATDW